MSRYLFIESNTTGTGRLAVERLIAAGHHVTFLTRTRAKYPFLASGSPRLDVHDLDTNDVDAVVRALRDRQAHPGVDAVLTFSEFYVVILAEAAARLGLRHLNPATARVCREKPRTREALRRAGLLTPDFWVVGSDAEARAVSEAVTYPCVVKPPADSSSHGVRMVADAVELIAQTRLIRGWTENVRGQRVNGEALVESLLDGPEFSVETMTLGPGETHVVGVTGKHLSAPPHFVEMGHDFPVEAALDVTGELAATVVAALAAVQFDFGPAHTEIKWTSRGPVIVEINPRLAGGMIPEVVAHATGIDLLGAWLDLAAGHPIDLTPRRQDVASIRFLTAPMAGRLMRTDGVEAARRLATVREIAVTRPVGADVRPAEDAYDRIGFVIASGPDRDPVRRDVNRALETIRFDVEAAQHAGA